MGVKRTLSPGEHQLSLKLTTHDSFEYMKDMSERFLSTQPYKGTRDFYPAEALIQRLMFQKLREVAQSYTYQEYDGPMLEPFELYAAKSGEEIVNQQLYWLIDRGERKLAIRPEMTPTMARMVAAKIHELPRPIRWFSFPNLWRYERPQRGRLREHWQLNADVLGGDSGLADAEIIALALDLMKSFGGDKFVSVRVNNRRLVDFFFTQNLGLSANTALALSKAVDARAKIGEEAYQKWLLDLGLNDEQRLKTEHFFGASFDDVVRDYHCQGVDELVQLFALLKEAGAEAQVVFDPKVMRGMTYYTGTVFEVYDTSPENRRAMFGGGRYDDLIGLFGSQKLSGVGFGMGDVTLRDFLESHKLLPDMGSFVDVLVTLPKRQMRSKAEQIARALRDLKLRVMTPLEEGGFGAQLKTASKHGARFAVLLGEVELARGDVLIKNLSTGEQVEVPIIEVSEWIMKQVL